VAKKLNRNVFRKNIQNNLNALSKKILKLNRWFINFTIDRKFRIIKKLKK